MEQDFQIRQSGQRKMVNIPPLAPSARWFSRYIEASGSSAGSEEIAIANSIIDNPRDFGRFFLEDTRENKINLSIAIEGGGKQLRTFSSIEDLRLSEHGDWRKIHLGAIEACLGRKPFYRELEPKLSGVYLNRDIVTLREFNTAIFSVLNSFLMENISKDHISLFYQNERLRERGKEIKAMIHPEISMIQILSELGKEAVLGILSFSDV